MANDRISNAGTDSRHITQPGTSTVHGTSVAATTNRPEPVVVDEELARFSQRLAAVSSQGAAHLALFFANTLGRWGGQTFLFAVNKNASTAMFQASGAIPVALIKAFLEPYLLSLTRQLKFPDAEKSSQYTHSQFYKDIKSVLEATAYVCGVFIVKAAFEALLARTANDFLKGLQNHDTKLGLASAVTILDFAYQLATLGIILAMHGRDRAIYKRPPLNPLNNENARAVGRVLKPSSYSEFKKNNKVTNQVLVDTPYRLATAGLGEVAFPLAMAKAVPGAELTQARFLNVALGAVLRLVRGRFEDFATGKMGGYKSYDGARILELPDDAPYAHGDSYPLVEDPRTTLSQARLSEDRISEVRDEEEALDTRQSPPPALSSASTSPMEQEAEETQRPVTPQSSLQETPQPGHSTSLVEEEAEGKKRASSDSPQQTGIETGKSPESPAKEPSVSKAAVTLEASSPVQPPPMESSSVQLENVVVGKMDGKSGIVEELPDDAPYAHGESLPLSEDIRVETGKSPELPAKKPSVSKAAVTLEASSPVQQPVIPPALQEPAKENVPLNQPQISTSREEPEIEIKSAAQESKLAAQEKEKGIQQSPLSELPVASTSPSEQVTQETQLSAAQKQTSVSPQVSSQKSPQPERSTNLIEGTGKKEASPADASQAGIETGKSPELPAKKPSVSKTAVTSETSSSVQQPVIPPALQEPAKENVPLNQPQISTSREEPEIEIKSAAQESKPAGQEEKPATPAGKQ